MACSPADFIDLQLGVGDGASEGAQEVQTVDGNKEQKLTLPTGASLTLSKGAVDHTVDIGIERPSDEDSIPFVKNLPQIAAINSAPYVLTPHGTQFKSAVTLELPVAKDRGRELVVAYLENESDTKWKKLGTPTVENGIAKINLEHFSVVILLDAADAKLSTASGTGGSNGSPDSQAGSGTSGGVKLDAGSTPIALPGDAGAIDLPFDPAKYDAGNLLGLLDGGYPGSTQPPVAQPDAFVPPAASANAFVDNGDGTVTDTNSNLTWEKEVTQVASYWDVGVSHCTGLTLPGSGWRMPTQAELKTIVNTQFRPTIDPKFFPNTPGEKFWTADPNGTKQHWYIDFQSGYPNAGSTNEPRTRCVRGGVAQ